MTISRNVIAYINNRTFMVCETEKEAVEWLLEFLKIEEVDDYLYYGSDVVVEKCEDAYTQGVTDTVDEVTDT